MTYAAVALGFVLGVLFGFLLAARHAEQLHQDNDRLRTVLRYLRGIAIQHPELRLREYIERALDDEAGA